MKVNMLINVKVQTNVDILTCITMINTTIESNKAKKKKYFSAIFIFYVHAMGPALKTDQILISKLFDILYIF